MNTIRTFLLLLLATYPSAARANTVVELKSDQLIVQVDASENANLIYQLDCLGGVARCGRDVFQALWQTQLSFDAEDRRRIEDWGRFRSDMQRLGGTREQLESIKSSLPFPPQDSDSPWEKIRAGDFVAQNDRELEKSWRAFVPADTVARGLAIVAHFRPRFQKWWADNESTAGEFVPALETAMQRAKAFELLSVAARFYGAELGDGRVYVHLIVQPKLKRTYTSGERIGAHFAVEIVPDEIAAERVPVIVHELAHHVFGRMPARLKAGFLEAIMAADPSGVPAWNLFDEVQATVIGNILARRNVSSTAQFQTLLDRPQSFYADEAIDLGARATYSLFETAFARGGAMVSSFAGEYSAAMRKGLGARLETLALYFRAMVSNFDEEDAVRQTSLRHAIGASSVWGVGPVGGPAFAAKLESYPALSAVVIVRADRLHKLEGLTRLLGVSPDALKQTLGASGGIVHVAKRTAQAYSMILVARDAGKVDALIAGLGQCELKPGVCMRIE